MNVFIIVNKTLFNEQISKGFFKITPFIHSSTKEQLPKTINKFKDSSEDLLIVEVKSTKAKWEPSKSRSNDGLFAHFYDEIPKEDIVSISPFRN